MEHDEKKNSTYLYLPIPTYPGDIHYIPRFPELNFSQGGISRIRKKKKKKNEIHGINLCM